MSATISEAAARPPKGDRLRALFPPLIALAAFAFLPALRDQFAVDTDDWINYVSNPDFRGLGWTQLKWMFGEPHFGHYIPLAWLTLGLDYKLWGMNPAGYHLTNLLLHAANAVVFYFVSRRLLNAALPERAAADETGLALAAAFSALLFALHPLRVESVVWVTERRDVLSGLFYLSSILCYLKRPARESSFGDRRRYSASVALYFLALLSKVSCVTLALILLVLDVYPLRRLPADPRRWFSREHRPVWREKLPYALAAIPAAAMAVFAQSRFGSMMSLGQIGYAGRVAVSAYAPAFYLGKTLLPTRLMPLYAIPLPFDPFQRTYVLCGVLILSLSAVFFLARRRFPAGLAVWAAYLAALLPMLGIVTLGNTLAADRYTYLACLGWAVLAGGGLLSLGRHARAGFAAAAGILLVLAAMSWKQSLVWHDSTALWEHVLAVHPELPQPHYGRGLQLMKEGNFPQAEEQFAAAVKLKSDYVEARNYLGMTLFQLGRVDEAVSQYNLALLTDPGAAAVHNNLGLALVAKGRGGEAIAHYRRALELSPELNAARINLANELFAERRADEAIEQYRAALSLEPNSENAHNNLGYVLASQLRLDEAIAHFRRALAIKPDFADADDNLGMALASQGKFDEAISAFKEALRLFPGDMKARKHMSVAAAMKAGRGR